MQFSKISSTLGRLGVASAALLAPAVAFAQTAAAPVAEAAAAAPVPDKGDTAFMFLCTILVLFMLVPGLGLFYGGLVRAKNMLSVLMQCTVIGATMMIIWVVYGYSFAFGGAFITQVAAGLRENMNGWSLSGWVRPFRGGIARPARGNSSRWRLARRDAG